MVHSMDHWNSVICLAHSYSLVLVLLGLIKERYTSIYVKVQPKVRQNLISVLFGA